MSFGSNDNPDDDLQDYIAADDEGGTSPGGRANRDSPNSALESTLASAVDTLPEVTRAHKAGSNLDDQRFESTGIPISAPPAIDTHDALQRPDAVQQHKEAADSDHFVVEGENNVDDRSGHHLGTTETDVGQTTDIGDSPVRDPSSPDHLTHISQLQTMADLFRRHQLEQASQNFVPSAGSDNGRDLAAPLQTQPGEGSSRPTAITGAGEASVTGEQHGDAVSPGLKDPQHVSDSLFHLSPQSAPVFIPPALRPPSTVLGKRKASSDPMEEISHSIAESRGLDEEIDECLGSTDMLTPSGKKKRRSRARKPQALPPSKVVGQPLSQVAPVTLEVSPAPEPQIFKHEAQRRWRRIDPYVAMIKVIMKERLKDGWTVMMKAIAEVTADGEEKDIRRVKQTWANEFTRLKSQAEKGRLVTLADLNCSWPWNLAEKKILWMTGVALCANKVTWAAVAAETSRVAKNCGEQTVTEEECKAEWDNVLKHEYLDTPAPPSETSRPSTRQDLSSKNVSLQHHSDETTLESANSTAQGSSARATPHSKPTRSRTARIGDRYEPGNFNDFLQADESLLRLLEEGPFSERPLNQPLQVQPPRETNEGAKAKMDSVPRQIRSKAGGTSGKDKRQDRPEAISDDTAQGETLDEVSDADEGDYVVLGEDDVEADPTK